MAMERLASVRAFDHGPVGGRFASRTFRAR